MFRVKHPLGLLLLVAIFTVPLSRVSSANDRVVLYPRPDPNDTGELNWIEAIESRVPPLTHSLNGRWPLVLWRVIEPDQITPESAAMLLARGIVPSLPMTESAIKAARIVQEAGAPVVLTAGSGAGTAWPYTLQPDRKDWAYEFDRIDVPDAWRGAPVPTLFAGWAKASAQIKRSLLAFKRRGIEVDAAWLDYEGLPVLSDYDIAVSSANGRKLLPPESLSTRTSFARYTRQLWTNLLSTYIAAPIREVFPRVSVTNWGVMVSLPDAPILGWDNRPLPLVGPTLFTATNPIAYGIDTAFKAGARLNAMTTQSDVDRVYTRILLRQVSADGYARDQIAPELGSVVWIARWVQDDRRSATPMMSRPAYREALRHLWLRGVDAMEIFRPVQAGFSAAAIQEVEDAAMVFNETLGYSGLLASGRVMNYAHELPRSSRILWSGIHDSRSAVLRVISLTGGDDIFDISLWNLPGISLQAPTDGATYRLVRDPTANTVTVENFSDPHEED